MKNTSIGLALDMLSWGLVDDFLERLEATEKSQQGKVVRYSLHRKIMARKRPFAEESTPDQEKPDVPEHESSKIIDLCSKMKDRADKK